MSANCRGAHGRASRKTRCRRSAASSTACARSLRSSKDLASKPHPGPSPQARGIGSCRVGPDGPPRGISFRGPRRMLTEELLAAPLNGKRLLALWNALPGVQKRRKVGDRAALIEQLWSAIERLPEPEPRADATRPSKQEVVIAPAHRPTDPMTLEPVPPTRSPRARDEWWSAKETLS